MLLTAARFYSTPSNGNARLLFRASLLHLPIFMIAFLLHRKPNVGQDRAEVLAHNARLLGFGSALRTTTPILGMGELAGEPGTGTERQSKSGFGHAMGKVSLPPLPFLPAPHQVISLECPSKAKCDDG